ncbi:MAG: Wzz/FepE/Etk N-terminal domain-containing protein [Clostridiaceae bacterium]
MNEESISLGSLWKIIKAKLIAIIGFTLLATIAAGLITVYSIEPKYKSTVAVFINDIRATGTGENEQQTINDINMFEKLVDTYSEITRSRTVTEDVIKELSLSLSVEEVQKMISSSAKGNTQFLNISITSTDNKMSYDIANQVALSLKKTSMILRGTDIVQILDPANLPTSPSSPSLMLNLAIGFFTGMMISLFGALLLDFIDKTIKDPKYIITELDLPFLGTIPVVKGAVLY